MNEDVFVYRTDLPPGCNEFTTINGETPGYTIYIDRSLDEEQALRAYHHAIGHIENGDFDKYGASVSKIEIRAHEQ